MSLTDHEVFRLNSGLRGTGSYYSRCFTIAKRLFLSGHSLDHSIAKAREQYGF